MSKVIGVIPARYNSKRFPGKPLIKIKGISMIEWTYKNASLSQIDNLYVATDDKRIFQEVLRFQGNVILTSSEHTSGTSRIIETIENIPEKNEIEMVVNIQGDEPNIEKELINGVISLKKKHSHWSMTTAAVSLKKDESSNNNKVKVIFDKNYKALYFSRLPIPYNSKVYFRHIGIYAYNIKLLLEYNKLQSELEKSENLEQLRVLENGYEIGIFLASKASSGVDTPEDVSIVEKEIEERLKNK